MTTCERSKAGHFPWSSLRAQVKELLRFCAIFGTKQPYFSAAHDCLAEREGFEPPVPFPVQRFSRPPVSTTHTSLRGLSHQQFSSIPKPSHWQLWGLLW